MTMTMTTTTTTTTTMEKKNRQVTRDELRANNGGATGRLWICVKTKVYDMTDFEKIHPGGDIIRIAGGQDATCLFESHHAGSSMPYVNSMLIKHGTLIGTLIDAEKADNTFYVTVQQRVESTLKSHNLARHAYEWFAYIEILFTLVAYFAAFYYRVTRASYLGGLLMGICIGRLGFLMHMGNHSGISKYPSVNAVVGKLMDLMGGSSFVWKYEHQVAHHTEPNVPFSDNDCTIADPIFRLHPALPHRWWHRPQFVLVPLGMTVGLVKWLFSDIFDFRRGGVGSISFSPHLSDWLLMSFFKIMWVVLYIGVPAMYTDDWSRIIFPSLLAMAVGGHYMENIFIVNHIQPSLQDPVRDAHWAVKQAQTTTNWGAGSNWANMISGGLNHQIEHHLFPSMTHYVYPLIAPVVKQTCKEFNLPYYNFPTWSSAWWSMISYLYVLGNPTPSRKDNKAT
jgi:fatty acid desaturase/predicted heme/steroid binding protein